MGRSVPVHAVCTFPLQRSPRPALPTLLCKVSPQGAGAAASGRPGPACSWPDAAPVDPQFVPPPPFLVSCRHRAPAGGPRPAQLSRPQSQAGCVPGGRLGARMRARGLVSVLQGNRARGVHMQEGTCREQLAHTPTEPGAPQGLPPAPQAEQSRRCRSVRLCRLENQQPANPSPGAREEPCPRSARRQEARRVHLLPGPLPAPFRPRWTGRWPPSSRAGRGAEETPGPAARILRGPWAACALRTSGRPVITDSVERAAPSALGGTAAGSRGRSGGSAGDRH